METETFDLEKEMIFDRERGDQVPLRRLEKESAAAMCVVREGLNFGAFLPAKVLQ